MANCEITGWYGSRFLGVADLGPDRCPSCSWQIRCSVNGSERLFRSCQEVPPRRSARVASLSACCHCVLMSKSLARWLECSLETNTVSAGWRNLMNKLCFCLPYFLRHIVFGCEDLAVRGLAETASSWTFQSHGLSAKTRWCPKNDHFG